MAIHDGKIQAGAVAFGNARVPRAAPTPSCRRLCFIILSNRLVKTNVLMKFVAGRRKPHARGVSSFLLTAWFRLRAWRMKNTRPGVTFGHETQTNRQKNRITGCRIIRFPTGQAARMEGWTIPALRSQSLPY